MIFYDRKIKDQELQHFREHQEEIDTTKAQLNRLTLHCESFESEKKRLELQISEMRKKEADYEEIAQQYAQIIGHQNVKQKIHHTVNLKDKNQKLVQVCIF